jgi:hypothetical protein
MAAEEWKHEEWNAIVVQASGAAKMADCGFPEKFAITSTTEDTEKHGGISFRGH